MSSPIFKEIKKLNPNIEYSIDNFVAVFDGCFSEDACKGLVDYFEECDRAGVTEARQEYHHGFNRDKIDDESLSFLNKSHALNSELRFKAVQFENIFWNQCYKLYAEKYSTLTNHSSHTIYTTKIQRTEKGQGYHVWHSDSEFKPLCNRLLVFILYLNDVEEGGETEFLYISKRVKPKAGRFILFPASLTHTHRGNPPISNTKYIFTGWVEM